MNSKGSEWNRWDLHFHTPSSYDYKDKTVSNVDIVNEMKRNSIAAFAVTDHHVIDIDRYKELKELGKKEGITVLPGIEFLSDARGKDPVHFIGIFSEDSNIEHIWGQIKHKTDINKVDSEGLRENQVYCDLKDTINLVKELGGIVTIHAGEKSGTVENITHSLPHGTAQKTEIAKAVDIYELGKENDQDGYRNFVFPNIGKTIPMIICSDNHNIKKYQLKQKLWIKGAPSFKGLKYALNEPESRFYIGDEPEIIKRVRSNPTKYIKSINIRRTGKEDASSIWFEDISIPMNSELVTVIGHKGSGKSALSDILALCSDADHSDDYIFLHKQKFKKKGLADRFSAFVEFESGKRTEERLLTHVIDESQERLVRYLPQSYFEKVCNEIDKVDAFRSEIEKVVFQYVPTEKKMGQTTFEELIDLKKKSADKEIHHIHEQILELNDEIIKLENQFDPSFRKNLLSKIKVKEDELHAHESLKPKMVEDPSKHAESEDTKTKKKALEELESSKLAIENQIQSITKEISNRNYLIVEAEKLNRDLKNKYREITSIISESSDFSDKCGFDISKAIRIDFDENVISSRVLLLKEMNAKDADLIKVEDDWEQKEYESLSPASKFESLKAKIKAIHSEFTGEQKAFQDYLSALAEWKIRKNEINGDSETADSLIYMREKLDYLDKKLELDISEKRDLRIKKSISILSKKKEIQEFYEEIKEEISKKLLRSDVSGLSIASSFYCSNEFKNTILRNIKQNRVGSFYGSEDGSMLLQEELISVTNWNDEASVETFLRRLIEYLEFDKRASSKNEKTFIGEVTKDRVDLYSYVYGLSFIEPYYDLRQRGKSLEQLSPGEKGALLLVFYLVLDKEDIPLVIDQPEDNLDNNSVAKVLVPYIKEAKKHRQIIMVTHNPNLAVVADSEQVIKVSIDKENGNKFCFISGGIENPKINEQIVEVLEGTIPAFSLRKDKYQIA
ncbi:PHP domain-containing protein [Vibrio cholerae]|nr:PHP domain-containing protein [Vibrio cholerae]